MGILQVHSLDHIETPVSLISEAEFRWPDWAYKARIAGAYFAPGESDASVLQRLRALADQNVSVVLADSPWGQEFETWVDDARFASVRLAVASMVEKAHALGLKVVMYQTGLELLSSPGNKPGPEYLKWAQIAIDGRPILFNDITNDQQHWLNDGVWDFWVTPCGDGSPGSDTFRSLCLRRVRDMVSTGIDGLWVDQVYLQGSAGHRDDMWPSTDPCSAALFMAQTGFAMPTAEDWNDPSFRRWIVWRHSQITEFLQAVKRAARSVNPQLVFMNENSCVDSGRSTYVGTDPTCLLPCADMSTGHEIETIADRMDKGETGMQAAALDDWLAYRTMVAFARGADKRKPSWILTYGYKPADSAILAGLTLAEGACFYETKGPQMADTVSASFRKRLFAWICEHEQSLYGGESTAQVALLYSPRNRDLVDTVSGEPYDVQDSNHFAAYRSAANALHRAHVPFDVVIDTDTAAFARYRILVAPQLQLMSDATVYSLLDFTGKIVAIGEIGQYDEWLEPRITSPFASSTLIHLYQPGVNMAEEADTGLLATSADPTVQIGLRRSVHTYTLIIVNTDKTPTDDFAIDMSIDISAETVQARLYQLNGFESSVAVELVDSGTRVHLRVPAGIDSMALIDLQLE